MVVEWRIRDSWIIIKEFSYWTDFSCLEHYEVKRCDGKAQGGDRSNMKSYQIVTLVVTLLLY